jgi:hypothetical protein
MIKETAVTKYSRGTVRGVVLNAGELYFKDDGAGPIQRVTISTVERACDLRGRWRDSDQTYAIVFYGPFARQAERFIRVGQCLVVDGCWEQRAVLDRQTAEEKLERELCARRFEILGGKRFSAALPRAKGKN